MRKGVCQVSGHKNLGIHTFFQSRLPRKFQSRFSHNLIKSSRDSQHHSSSLYHTRILNLVETYHIHLDELYHHTHTYLTGVRDSCILDVYTSRYTYIMHKCVYTVTLDIECWNDLKVDKIDWARSINLFPDEYIHSSVQELTSPRPVDSI